MSERFIVETQIGGAFFFRLFKPQGAGANGYAIAVFESVFEFLFAVDKYFVGAALDLAVNHDAVEDRKRAVIVRLEVRMVTRGPRVIQDHLIVGSAPNHAEHACIEFMLRLAPAGVSNFQSSHKEVFSKEISLASRFYKVNGVSA